MSSINLRKDDEKTELALMVRDNQGIKELAALYPEEKINKLLDNKDKLDKIVSYFKNAVGTSRKSILAMKCNPTTCPYKTSCILLKNDMAPDGYACPIEQKIALELESSIVEELDIDSQSTIEMEQLYDYIDAKLLDMRTSGLLADGSVVQIIENRHGAQVSKYNDVAPEFKIKMDLKRLKASIMEEFMATRRSKKRYGLNTGDKSYESIVREAMRVDNG